MNTLPQKKTGLIENQSGMSLFYPQNHCERISFHEAVALVIRQVF
jgi:hypothetical protein